MKSKRVVILSIIAFAFFVILVVFTSVNVKTQITELFKMNKELQEEGYYVGDFEFKMMSFAYYLDKGHYIKSLLGINKLHKQMASRQGLVKIPKFENKEEELEFYLNLQNPNTGAFIDDDYPYLVYNEITENSVDHIAAISDELNKSLELKYPLKYLDEINTSEKLILFLDDVSYVSWLANKFPQTTYVFARSTLSYLNDEGAISKNGLYNFSLEWKTSLLEWFYENQDPETGFWGPRSRINQKLLRKDLTNTVSMIKTLVDRNGNDIYDDFPLRYKDRIIQTTLEVLNESIPKDDEFDEIHEWSLKMSRGISMLTRYLWGEMNKQEKEVAREIIENYVKIKFEKNYISNEGAFSYYPNEEHATLDGMGNFFLFNDLGVFLPEKQKELWGNPEIEIIDLKEKETYEIQENDIDELLSFASVNSIRVYVNLPKENYLENVKIIFYGKETSALDILDLTPKIKNWTKNTQQTMGNWMSKESALQDLEIIKVNDVAIYNDIPIEEINQILQNNGNVVLVGFDVLQIPRYKMTFRLKD